MIKIAHRGNVDGPSALENSPGLLLNAIEQGFDVEVDIRSIDGSWYLGHDEPTYIVGDMFIDKIKKYSWLHCKNLEALNKLDKKVHKYYHKPYQDLNLQL